MRETARGLEFDGSIIRAIPRGEEAWQLLRGVDGIPVCKFSIGYECLLSATERDGTRTLKQVALYEISVVSMPANEGSVLLSLQDGKDLDATVAKMRALIADIKRTVLR